MEIISRELALRPVTLDQIEAYSATGRAGLARLLGVDVPSVWPLPETEDSLPRMQSQLTQDAALEGWLLWLVLHRVDRTLIGDAGFAGRPDADGMLALICRIVPAYRQRGYDLQTARALVGWAFAHSEVRGVRAETPHQARASHRVLQRLGIQLRMQVDQRDPDRLHWEILRAAWETAAAGTDPIRLAPLSPMDWAVYREQAVRNYAAEKVRAGNWAAEDALARAEADFTQLLPQGIATPGHLLYAIEEAAADTLVGVLWVGTVREGGGPAMAYLYDFVIYPGYRRRGYGAAALYALESVVRGMGLDTIGLHVFGHNHAARALYERLGYQVTNLNMSKRLLDPHDTSI
ncbi:MAG: GNAT family N-acetyltransferase [Anaerolineae bacterium]